MSPRFLLLILAVMAATAVRADIYCNSTRGFGAISPEYSASPTLLLSNQGPDEISVPLPAAPLYLNIRAINRHANPNKSYPAEDTRGKNVKIKYPEWGVRFIAGSDTLSYSFATINPTDPLGEPQDRLRATAVVGRGKPRSTILSSGVELFNAPNLFLFEHRDNSMTLRLGNSKKLKDIPDEAFPAPESAFITLAPGASVEILDMTIRTAPRQPDSPQIFSREEIDSLLKRSAAPLTGIYELYEFDIDKEKTILPDRLRLALIPADDAPGAYTLLYISGYPDSEQYWRPGMTKGRISPSPFKDYYYLDWITADGHTLSKGCSLTSDALPVLLLQFPYQNVKFTIRRIPHPNE